MKNTFTYNLLQYKHSFVVREAVNVGILFSFDGPQYRFVQGNIKRLKDLYFGFDTSFFNHIVRGIKQRVDNDLNVPQFQYIDSKVELNKSVRDILILEDSTSLQFTEPIEVVNTYNDIDFTVERFSKLLLPGIEIEPKEKVIKHDESFILKRYSDFVSKTSPLIHKIKRNIRVEDRGGVLDFDIAWQNQTLHLVKPISFDLNDSHVIHNKATQYYGNLNLLGHKARSQNYIFDLLIAPPQNKDLDNAFKEALYILNQAEAPTSIVKNDKELVKYSELTVSHLTEEE